jgi:hypothetical protein
VPINTFQFNEHCPHLCWLGINPGVTTSQDAIKILSLTNHIDQESLQVSSSQSYEAVWYAGPAKVSKTTVYMDLKNGLVWTISFDNPPFSLSDFMNLIGKPDEIRFMVMRTAETTEVIYAIYFSSARVMIESGDQSGPEPGNSIVELWLNMDFSNTTFPPPTWGAIQPWLGYGHIKDYLPRVGIPTLIPISTP